MSVPDTLLTLLDGGPCHGYDLKRSYDELFAHARPLQFGQIYGTLQRLERDGLIALEAVSPGQGPDRKRYSITPAGSDRVRGWLDVAEEPEPYLQPALYIKLALALRTGRDAEGLLDRQAARHRDRMRELTALRRSLRTVDQVVADHALVHLEADLRWIEETRARLDALRAEIGSGA